jgi:hypothetical protein
MNLAGRAVLIRLTAVGRRALEGVVTVTEKGSFEALVDGDDHRGVWVNPRGENEPADMTFLVKWEFIATMQIIEE